MYSYAKHTNDYDQPTAFKNTVNLTAIGGLNWTVYTQKIADKTFTWQQVVDSFKASDVTTIQNAIKGIEAEKAAITGLTKRARVATAINKLKELLKTKTTTTNTNTGASAPGYVPPSGLTGGSLAQQIFEALTPGYVPPSGLDGTGSTALENENTKTDTTKTVFGIPTKYLVYGGIGVGVIVAGAIIYNVVKNNK